LTIYETKELENAWMVSVYSGFCRLPCADALGASCRRHSDLNVSIVQRRVSAQFRHGEKISNIRDFRSGLGLGSESGSKEQIEIGVRIGIGDRKTDPDTDADPDEGRNIPSL
jgi:hypothetical protein